MAQLISLARFFPAPPPSYRGGGRTGKTGTYPDSSNKSRNGNNGKKSRFTCGLVCHAGLLKFSSSGDQVAKAPSRKRFGKPPPGVPPIDFGNSHAPVHIMKTDTQPVNQHGTDMNNAT